MSPPPVTYAVHSTPCPPSCMCDHHNHVLNCTQVTDKPTEPAGDHVKYDYYQPLNNHFSSVVFYYDLKAPNKYDPMEGVNIAGGLLIMLVVVMFHLGTTKGKAKYAKYKRRKIRRKLRALRKEKEQKEIEDARALEEERALDEAAKRLEEAISDVEDEIDATRLMRTCYKLKRRNSSFKLLPPMHERDRQAQPSMRGGFLDVPGGINGPPEKKKKYQDEKAGFLDVPGMERPLANTKKHRDGRLGLLAVPGMETPPVRRNRSHDNPLALVKTDLSKKRKASVELGNDDDDDLQVVTLQVPVLLPVADACSIQVPVLNPIADTISKPPVVLTLDTDTIVQDNLLDNTCDTKDKVTDKLSITDTIVPHVETQLVVSTGSMADPLFERILEINPECPIHGNMDTLLSIATTTT